MLKTNLGNCTAEVKPGGDLTGKRKGIGCALDPDYKKMGRFQYALNEKKIQKSEF